MRIWLLVVILIASFAIRLHHLDEQSLWSDEGYSVHEAHKPLLQLIHDARYDHNPPLYYLLLKAWIMIFGDSDFAVRLLSVVIGVAVVGVGYLLGTKLWSERAGLVAAFLLAIAQNMVLFSQETRAYMLVTLLVMLSYYYRDRFWPHAITSTLALYTHYYAILFLVAQVKTLRRKTVYVIGALFIPALVLLSMQLKHFAGTNFALRPDFVVVGNLFFSYTGNWELFGLLAVLAVHSSREKRNESIWLWWLLPIAISICVSMIVPIFEVRYLMPAAPAFMLLAARGIDRMSHKALQMGVLLVILLLASHSLLWQFDHPQKEDWKGAVSYLDDHARYQDAIIFYPGFTKELLYDRYSTGTDATLIMLTYDTRPLGKDDLARLESYEWFSRVFVVTTHAMDTRLIAKALHYHKTNSTDFRKITITEFVR